jgi:pimeloyl-ACP methyl ester carboxylesterase
MTSLGIALLVVLFVISVAYVTYKLYLAGKTGIGAPLLKDGEFCEIQGHRMHFIQKSSGQKGSGEDVLFIHGLGASHFVWRFLLSQLSQYFKVTAIDLIGFGKSDKPNTFAYDLDSQCQIILEFMDKMDIQKCVLVGSSMGGMIALRLAQTHPERFPRLVAISPAYDPQITFFDLNRFQFLSPMVGPFISERVIQQIMTRVYTDKSLINKETIQAFSQPYNNNPLAIESFVKSFRLLRDPRVFQELPQIKVPTLILWGDKDKVISSKFASKIKKSMPFAEVLIHPTAGHHAHEDAPDWAFENILRFLRDEKTSKIL